jgi:hypothetical protein
MTHLQLIIVVWLAGFSIGIPFGFAFCEWARWMRGGK